MIIGDPSIKTRELAWSPSTQPLNLAACALSEQGAWENASWSGVADTRDWGYSPQYRFRHNTKVPGQVEVDLQCSPNKP